MVATRASGPGQRAAMAALGNLRRHYDPTVLGDSHRSAAPTRAAGGPGSMVAAVNSFFTDHGEPAELRTGPAASFRVLPGLVGSGDAVMADRQSKIRKYLGRHHDKVLAVDMEAGGLSQFCHETTSASGAAPGWVVIRGISDQADHAKNDDRHASAARNAAHTLRHLIPYLHAGG